jgi:TRAP-type C4-dicarboxylate transport system substrate-binding protein
MRIDMPYAKRGGERRAPGGRLAARLLRLLWAAVLPLLSLLAMPAAATAAEPAVRLRIVGGLAGLHQYTRHEEPFWSRELSRMTGGRASAEVVPFDRAGIRGQEMLRLVQLGAVPFGTALLSVSATQDPELAAPDLAGLNPGIDSSRRSVAAFRPYLQKMLRERYGIELLALYAYPAQVIFCSKPLAGLADLARRRVRTSSPSQADLMEALGAVPVQTGFAEIVANVRSGNLDCAITGTMSGNTIGLHEVTTHIHSAPINWGLAAFVANGAAWEALPKEVQALLRQELPRLEQAIWAEAGHETGEGVACNTGASGCRTGRAGRMKEVPDSPADQRLRREILVNTVLPRWARRCGPQCAQLWQQTLGPALGIELR